MKRIMRYYRLKIIQYFTRVGIAFSVLLNVILGGPSNQTFSARNYHWKLKGNYNIVFIIDKIFWFDPNHCLMSYIYWRTARNLRKKQHYKEMSDNYLRKDILFYNSQE